MSNHAVLVSTGMYLPEKVLTNAELIARVGEQHREYLEKMERSTAIKQRYVAPDDWATSDLALPAAKQALERAGLRPEDIDLIVLGTDSPDYITPCTSVVVQQKLGATKAGTFDVGCACASFPTAIASAAGIIATSPGIDNVLVIGVYMMRKLADAKDPVSFFYGDGAGAAVLKRSESRGYLASAYRADGSYAKKWVIASGGTVEPASEESVRAGRTNVRMIEGYPRIVNEEGWPAVSRQVIERAKLTIPEVDHFIFTQVRKLTIETVMKTLEAPIEKAHFIMEKWGYTGSACIPMALHDAVEGGKIKVGDKLLLVGSGVGHNQAGVLLEITKDLVGAK